MSAPDPWLERRRFVVSGGTGFLGSAFVRHVAGRDGEVTVLARPRSSLWRLADVEGQYDVVRADVTRLDETADAIGAGAIMVHFAAAGVNQAFDDLEEMIRTNVLGTAAALRFALRAGVTRFVLVGSSGEYGPGELLDEAAALEPTSEYGATRAAATLLARAFGARRGLDVVVVRPFAVYGPFEPAYRLIPYAIVQGLRGDRIDISAGSQTRDYVHVDDVSRGIAESCLSASAAQGVFNLCTGRQTSVHDAARLAAKLTGGRSRVEAGVRADIPGEMWRTSGNPARAREQLGWVPTHDLEAGLVATIEWFRKVGVFLPEYRALSGP